MTPRAELISPTGIVRFSINFPGNVFVERQTNNIAIKPVTASGASVITCVDLPSEIQTAPVLHLTGDEEGHVFEGDIEKESVDIERVKPHTVVIPVM